VRDWPTMLMWLDIIVYTFSHEQTFFTVHFIMKTPNLLQTDACPHDLFKIHSAVNTHFM